MPWDFTSGANHFHDIKTNKDFSLYILQKNLNLSKDNIQEKAMSNQRSHQNIAQNKTYLYIPFEDKNRASQLGARWDNEIRSWYARIGSDLNKFNQWRNPPYR